MSFPAYPKYKDSGVEWLGMVPEHWDVKRIRYVANLNPSKSEIAGLERSTLVSFLPMEAIGDDGSLELDREKPIVEVETGYTYFRDGDVVLAKITPCYENGKGAVMRDLCNEVGFGTTELIVVRPKHGCVTSTYLHYLFITPDFRSIGESHMYGAGGQKRVPDAFVRNFPTAFPPLPEQTAIAAFLDRETAKIDALVAEQKRLMELLKEKRQAVISHAVTGKAEVKRVKDESGKDTFILQPSSRPMKDSGIEWLGAVPEGWEVVPASYKFQVQLGKMLDTNKITGEHLRPYLRVFDVQWGSINVEDLPQMDFSPNVRDKFKLAQGDLLVNEGGSYPGRSAIWKGELEECYYQKALHRLRPLLTDADSTAFFYYVMFWAANHGVFAAGGNEATIEHLPAEKLRSYRFAFPPLPEQHAIVTYLDAETAKFDTLTAEAQRAIDLMQERRTALISAAVTGQIDVRKT